LVTFKILNLATRNCAKDWGKAASGEALGRVRVGDAKAVRLGNVYLIRNYKDFHNVKVLSQGLLVPLPR